jgi:hypothetical protein
VYVSGVESDEQKFQFWKNVSAYSEAPEAFRLLIR